MLVILFWFLVALLVVSTLATLTGSKRREEAERAAIDAYSNSHPERK